MLNDDMQTTVVAMAESISERVNREYPDDTVLRQMVDGVLRVSRPERAERRFDVNECEHPRRRE